jgi:hypothetical protein
MNQRIRQLIAVLEVGGGVAGVALVSMVGTAGGLRLWHRFLLGLTGLVFVLCAYAGRELWRNQPRGYALSMVVQAGQVVAWSSPQALYVFYCGASLGAWYGSTTLAPMAGIGSHLTASWATEPRAEAFGLNFLALWALWQLTRRWQSNRGTAKP